jgi:hypothetical protein
MSSQEPELCAAERTAKSIAIDMENDVLTVIDFATAIELRAMNLSEAELGRKPIVRLATLIEERATSLEEQRRRAAGQGRDDHVVQS